MKNFGSGSKISRASQIPSRLVEIVCECHIWCVVVVFFFGCRSAPTESSTNNPSKRSSSNSSRKEVRANDRERNGRVACGRAITLGRRLRRRKHHHIRTSFAIQISTPSLPRIRLATNNENWLRFPSRCVHPSEFFFFLLLSGTSGSIAALYISATYSRNPSILS